MRAQCGRYEFRGTLVTHAVCNRTRALSCPLLEIIGAWANGTCREMVCAMRISMSGAHLCLHVAVLALCMLGELGCV